MADARMPRGARHALDPPPRSPDWAWPYACHHYGHVYEIGGERCVQCGLPYRLDPNYDPNFD